MHAHLPQYLREGGGDSGVNSFNLGGLFGTLTVRSIDFPRHTQDFKMDVV